MDRLFTVFLSSTYFDLVDERQRLMQAMLRRQWVPLGMEFFPSTGRTQWPAITDALDAADLCLFVIAGRYGSIDSTESISWTHREFREAVDRGKPIVVAIHSKPGEIAANKTDPQHAEALEGFRAEITDKVHPVYWHSLDTLIDVTTSSLSATIKQDSIPGWSRGFAGSERDATTQECLSRVFRTVPRHIVDELRRQAWAVPWREDLIRPWITLAHESSGPESVLRPAGLDELRHRLLGAVSEFLAQEMPATDHRQLGFRTFRGEHSTATDEVYRGRVQGMERAADALADAFDALVLSAREAGYSLTGLRD